MPQIFRPYDPMSHINRLQRMLEHAIVRWADNNFDSDEVVRLDQEIAREAKRLGLPDGSFGPSQGGNFS